MLRGLVQPRAAKFFLATASGSCRFSATARAAATVCHEAVSSPRLTTLRATQTPALNGFNHWKRSEPEEPLDCPYEVLGVEFGASRDAIEEAFQARAWENLPEYELESPADAHADLQRTAAAYVELMDGAVE